MAKEQKVTIPSIVYRGPEDFIGIDSSTKVNYAFSQETNYTVTPESWEDFYEILLVDKSNIRDRLLVCSQDPLAKTNLRRKSPDDFVVPEVQQGIQDEIDQRVRMKNRKDTLMNEYIAKVNFQIATGKIDMIPETLQEDAEKYAYTEMSKEGIVPVIEDGNEQEEEGPLVISPEITEKTDEEERVNIEDLISADSNEEKNEEIKQ